MIKWKKDKAHSYYSDDGRFEIHGVSSGYVLLDMYNEKSIGMFDYLKSAKAEAILILKYEAEKL